MRSTLPATAAPPAAGRFPEGFTVAIRSDVRCLDDGLLVGGSPVRAVRLSPAARARLRGDLLTVTDHASSTLAGILLDRNIADPLLSGPVPEPGLLTVVVPIRDRPAQLDRALAALKPLSVLVVDDASLDPAAVARVALAHGATVLALSRNVGPAGARNAGLARVRTPYVAFVDSDVVGPSDMLLRLARHFADDRVALVGPRVVSRAVSATPRWHERYDESASSLALGTRPCSVSPGAAVGWLPSACLVARTDRLAAGFDESMRVGEDVDLVWRLVDAGQSVRYDPAETALHDARPTIRSWLGRKLLYGTGGAALAERHGSHGAPAVLSPAMALSAAALLARQRWSIPVAALGAAYAGASLHRRLPDTPDKASLAAGLAVEGLGWAVRQEAALALRHWWPLTAVLLPSRTARRMVVSALLVDAVVGRLEHPDARPLPQLLGRRLDDLAYGAGLWLGALRSRSVRCLLPRSPREKPTRPRTGDLSTPATLSVQ